MACPCEDFTKTDAPVFARPVIPLTAALAAGICAGGWAPGFCLAAWFAAAIGAVWVAWTLIRFKSGRLGPISLFFFIGYLSIQPWLSPFFPNNHIIHHAGGKSVRISGIVIEPPTPYAKGLRLVMAAARVERSGSPPKETRGRIRVSIENPAPVIRIGDRLSFESRIKAIKNFQNPGGFDYRRYMALKNIWVTAYLSKSRLQSLQVVRDEKRHDKISDFRERLNRLIVGAIGGKDEKAILRALILGDRSGVSSAVNEDFQRVGIGHLLAISGLHIGIVAAVSFMAMNWIFRFFPLLVWRGWTKKVAAVLSIPPVVGYAILAGMSPSTQRAAVMVAFFLLSFPLEKSYDGPNIIAVAALALLIFHPPLLFSISFQLSFSAVAAITLGSAWLSSVQTKTSVDTDERWWSKKAAAVLQTSAFAILGTLPFVARYFNTVSSLGIAGNFLVVPIVGFFVVPAGLLGVCMSVWSETAARLIFGAACLTLSLPLFVTRWLAQWPLSSFHIFTPTAFEMGLYYATGAFMMLFYKGRRKRKTAAAAAPSEAMATKTVAVVLLLCLTTVTADAAYWMLRRWWHADLKITYLDVGHGNAALLELPKGHTILVDGGGFSDNSVFDVGKYIVAPALWAKKIMKVDTVILSHPNSDHLNGLLFIIDHFTVDRIWSNNEAASTLGFEKFQRLAAIRGIPIVPYTEINGHHEICGVSVDVLHPPVDFLQRRKLEPWRTINNNCLVLRVSLESISFLFPGDIEADAEAALVHFRPNHLKSTLLLAPHHGSRSSSTRGFIAAVAPEIIVFSAGSSDWRPLPHPDVLKRYAESKCRMYITHEDGAVSIRTDGRHLAVESFGGSDFFQRILPGTDLGYGKKALNM